MSKITVTTIAGQTSGSDANLVKIESGDTLQALSNATVGGTLGVTGNTTLNGKLGIGDSTVLGNKVHIRTGGSATSVNASAGLVLEDDDSTRCDLQFMGPDGAFHSILFGDVSDDDIGKISYSHSGNNMRFTVNTAERMRLTADGLTFNGDTAAANALDDYEEGTFTPNLYHNGSNNSTFSSKTGEYTKIGNTVTCQIRIDHGNSGTAGTFLIIGGLPFAPAQANGTMGIGIWGSNPSSQVGNVMGGSNPTVYKGGTSITSQMSFLTAMLVYKTA